MKLRIAAAFAVAASAFVAAEGQAQTATQTVSYEVTAIDQISVTGSPSLVVSSATAGGAPASATATAQYAITTNGDDRAITAQVDSDLPTGVTLTAALEAPTGATSAGAQALTSTPVVLVSGITALSESNLDITYGLSATVAAGVVPAGNRTVTFTVTSGS